MTSKNAPVRSYNRLGFSLTELLVVLVIGGILLTSVLKLVLNQAQGYGKQLEVMDAREATRTAAGVLGWELRNAGIGNSTLTMITADSLALRSATAIGVVCGNNPALSRYGLSKTSGSMGATAADWVSVFQLGANPATNPNSWLQYRVTQVGTPTELGIPLCAGPGNVVPDVVIQLSVPTVKMATNIRVGAPIVGYQGATYAEIQSGGRWYLGRRIANGAAGWEPIAGPLLAPSSNGLKFTYFNAANAVTANPALVASVGVTAIAQSTKFVPGTSTYQIDTVSTKISLRR